MRKGVKILGALDLAPRAKVNDLLMLINVFYYELIDLHVRKLRWAKDIHCASYLTRLPST